MSCHFPKSGPASPKSGPVPKYCKHDMRMQHLLLKLKLPSFTNDWCTVFPWHIVDAATLGNEITFFPNSGQSLPNPGQHPNNAKIN